MKKFDRSTLEQHLDAIETKASEGTFFESGIFETALWEFSEA